MVKKIMVVGAGLMGSGISQTLATHGYHVTMVDIKKEYLKRSLENIECSLKRLIEKRKVSKEHADKTLGIYFNAFFNTQSHVNYGKNKINKGDIL